LAAPDVVPLRNAALLDSSGYPGNYAGNPPIVEGHLPRGLEIARQRDPLDDREADRGDRCGKRNKSIADP